MSTGILVIGLDAAEATLIEAWAAEGSLPTFAGLIAGGAVYRLENPMETLPGAIWPELVSGRSSGQVPLYYHPRQVRSCNPCHRRNASSFHPDLQQFRRCPLTTQAEFTFAHNRDLYCLTHTIGLLPLQKQQSDWLTRQ